MTLREARRRAGCSEAALERFARVPSGTIAEIEANPASRVDRSAAVRIAAVLCIDLNLTDEFKPVATRPRTQTHPAR